jgi:hypothetical protein
MGVCAWLIGHGRSRRHCGVDAVVRVRAGSRVVRVCPFHHQRATDTGWRTEPDADG